MLSRFGACAPGRWLLGLLLGGCLSAALAALQAETIILHLKNGDRLAGVILSEDTNRVVLSTTWIKELPVPVREIERREKAPETAKTGPTAAPTTNTVPPVSAGVPVAVTTVPSPQPAKKTKLWKGEARVGADFLSGAKDQEIFYARAKLTYERPYVSNPKEFFRNVLDYSLDYGKTEGVLSANRMGGSDKTDFDIGRHKFFLYNLAGIGYDQIRKIDLRYEVGPGVGYHLFTHTNFVANLELGANYQAEYRSDYTAKKDVYYRLAEDVTWKLQKRLTLTEKLEFFPRFKGAEYRFRFETTLSYGFWQNLSLNLTLLDLYDSQPAAGVPQNDIQIHSSVGITF